jgi:hypothetical protein
LVVIRLISAERAGFAAMDALRQVAATATMIDHGRIVYSLNGE